METNGRVFERPPLNFACLLLLVCRILLQSARICYNCSSQRVSLILSCLKRNSCLLCQRARRGESFCWHFCPFGFQPDRVSPLKSAKGSLNRAATPCSPAPMATPINSSFRSSKQFKRDQNSFVTFKLESVLFKILLMVLLSRTKEGEPILSPLCLQ